MRTEKCGGQLLESCERVPTLAAAQSKHDVSAELIADSCGAFALPTPGSLIDVAEVADLGSTSSRSACLRGRRPRLHPNQLDRDVGLRL